MTDLKNFQDYFDSDNPGLYALFINDESSLQEIFSLDWCSKISSCMKNNICKKCLYIGVTTKNLKDRIKKDHFKGTIRNSTLRNTISYCTNMKRYCVIGYNPSTKRKMTTSDEAKITHWIKKNTKVKILETNDYKLLEKELIKKYCPPLNIDYNPKRIIETGERNKNFIYIKKTEFDKLKSF